MSGRNQDDAAELRLSAAIAVAREQWPDRAALDRVRHGVAASVVVSHAPAGGRLQARLLRQSTKAWLRGGALALLLGGGFGAWQLGAGAPRPALAWPAEAQRAAILAVPAVPAAPAAAAQPATAEPELASPEPRRKLRARAPRAERAPAVPAATPAAVDPESELQLLRRALAALPHHPRQSLELAAEHARDYPSGIFGQEREVIAIDALVALQQTSAAEARARAFLARYPRSAHAPRIRAMLGGESKPGPAQMALGQRGR